MTFTDEGTRLHNHVTVVAQDAEAGRVALMLNPAIKLPNLYARSPSGLLTVRVVNGKKVNCGLPTTRALKSTMAVNLKEFILQLESESSGL
jgi:hypothetical protein